MTTAARPTWTPAKGHENQGYYKDFVPSKQYSSKDLPGHLELKVRQEGQGSEQEIKTKDLRAELEEKEKKHFDSRRKGEALPQITAPIPKPPPDIKLEDLPQTRHEDRDENFADDDSDEEESDDEDETAELMKELEKIKRERELEKEKMRMKEEKEKAEAIEKEVMGSNPLLDLGQKEEVFKMQRKWYDDVVFRNQAKTAPQKAQKRFINDTIRNDFHRRFLDRYIK